MKQIGTVTFQKVISKEILAAYSLESMSMQYNNIFLSISGGFISNFPLKQGDTYNLLLTGVEGFQEIPVIFKNYSFSVSSGDYIDLEGKLHEEAPVYSNQIQLEMYKQEKR